MKYISRIQSPKDVKTLDISSLNELAAEMRQLLVNKVSTRGGHFAPNLGMVEATIAMHYVFDSPTDKMVFDVSHQSYCHKMLTGRAQAFLNPAHYGDITGYSSFLESEHDHFIIGHTSTSVSLASGLAKGRDLVGGKWNVIAIIGDGSLSGGEALEGLDWAAEMGTNFIIVVNDNQMSIAENHGGLYDNLALLRETNGTAEKNLFKAMGLDYIYVGQGNDIPSLIEVFQQVKDIDHPIVVHINTLKGKGISYAEQNKETFHWSVPFNPETGEVNVPSCSETYDQVTTASLMSCIKEDERVCVITAGTPGMLGFTPQLRQEAGSQFVDVGIAEEHAVAMASGIAKAGGKPVFGVCSSFIQRTYDQLSQDLCINNNPATILVLWGSVATMTDVTHLCQFDVPLMSNIPNLVYLAPTNKEEYVAMLRWSLSYTTHPVAIRVPVGIAQSTSRTVATDYSTLNTFEQVIAGMDVAIIGLGNFYSLGERVHSLLKARGIEATLINPRFISGVDEPMLQGLLKDHQLVITLEDGVVEGGFGHKVAAYYSDKPMKVKCYGAKKAFVDGYVLSEFLAENRLVDTLIVEDIVQLLDEA